MAKRPVLARDESGEIGKRGDGHENRKEMALAMEFGQRSWLELAKLLLVQEMVSDEAVAGSVAQIDVESERFKKLIALKRCKEVAARPISLVEFVEADHDGFQIGCRTTILVECPNSFFSSPGNPLVVEVDVQLGWTLPTLGATDQERLD